MDEIVRKPLLKTSKETNKKADYFRWLLENGKPRWRCPFCKIQYHVGDETLTIGSQEYCPKCREPFGALTDLWKKAWNRRIRRPSRAKRSELAKRW